MSIYVGNILNEVTQGDLRGVFAESAIVNWDKLPINRETSRLWGDSFVKMGKEAVKTVALDVSDDEWVGRKLEISKAKPHKEKRSESGRSGNKSGGRA